MSWKNVLSRNGLLYAILDKEIIEQKQLDMFSLAERLLDYGVDILQFRFKDLSDNLALHLAKRLSKIVYNREAIFLVNDRVDIAYLSGANGVHLGRDDIPPGEARRILGKKRIIGKTIHSLEEFNKFKSEPVDYFSFGPVFRSPIKPYLPLWNKDSLKNTIRKVKKKYFVVGGISLRNINSVVRMGIKNIAVCRGLILSKDLKKTVRSFKKCLEKVS
ncbi:MAG: thiamine phosphate synthase [Candidatus Omnitrophica bacterium]|nr:thiamine phosphate synthase [Candidatus Omnitrophota bacterium]